MNGVAAYKAILERAPASDTALVYDRKTTGVTVSDHWPLAFETGTWTAAHQSRSYVRWPYVAFAPCLRRKCLSSSVRLICSAPGSSVST